MSKMNAEMLHTFTSGGKASDPGNTNVHGLLSAGTRTLCGLGFAEVAGEDHIYARTTSRKNEAVIR